MKLEDLKRIADARTKGRIIMDNDCDIDCLDETYWCEKLQCDLPKTFIPTHFTERGQQLFSNYEFIVMASNTFDKLIAVVEAAKHVAFMRIQDDDEEYNSAWRTLEDALKELEE